MSHHTALPCSWPRGYPAAPARTKAGQTVAVAVGGAAAVVVVGTAAVQGQRHWDLHSPAAPGHIAAGHIAAGHTASVEELQRPVGADALDNQHKNTTQRSPEKLGSERHPID